MWLLSTYAGWGGLRPFPPAALSGEHSVSDKKYIIPLPDLQVFVTYYIVYLYEISPILYHTTCRLHLHPASAATDVAERFASAHLLRQ